MMMRRKNTGGGGWFKDWPCLQIGILGAVGSRSPHRSLPSLRIIHAVRHYNNTHCFTWWPGAHTQPNLNCTVHTHTHTLCEGSVPLSPLARCIHGLQGRKTLMRVRNQPGHRTGPQQAPTHDATKLKHEQCNSMPINLVQNQTHIEKIYMDDLPFWLP